MADVLSGPIMQDALNCRRTLGMLRFLYSWVIPVLAGSQFWLTTTCGFGASLTSFHFWLGFTFDREARLADKHFSQVSDTEFKVQQRI